MEYTLLVLAGFLGASINAAAGGGSFIHFTVMMESSTLPYLIANGTNRIPLLFGNLASTKSFFQNGLLSKQEFLQTIIPMSIGTLIGLKIALIFPEEYFKPLLALLLLLCGLSIAFSSSSRSPSKDQDKNSFKAPDSSITQEDPQAQEVPKLQEPLEVAPKKLFVAFLLVGIYAGFIQAGGGFFVLAITRFIGIPLHRANALKTSCVLVPTLIALSYFAWHQQVYWTEGLCLTAGALVGGYFGADLTSKVSEGKLKAFVLITLAISAVLLLL